MKDPNVSAIPNSENLPIAYGGCTCDCHRVSGVMHVMACCHPIEIVTLKGKTAKGKQRIKRDGDTWTIEKRSDKVFFSGEKGPWLLITNGDPDRSRWVHMFNDQNFEVSIENG